MAVETLKDVDVMDEFVYNALSSYFHALEMKGYMLYKDAQKLLVLSFYKDFVFGDFRGILSREDYCCIEQALNCLYGTSCLIPYPDYLKMGKLNLGSITEMANRIKVLEDTSVVKVIHEDAEGVEQSDIVILTEEE